MTTIGLTLLVIGAIVLIVEAHVPTLGVLGGPGVIALAAGAVLAVITAFVLAAAGAGVVGLSLTKGAAVRRRNVRTGVIGHLGVVRKWHESKGTVLVDGALWDARPSHPECEQLHAGDEVVVERVTGLTLGVRKAEEWELVA